MAIVLKYGHRYSENFDFFSSEVPQDFQHRLERVFRKASEEGLTVSDVAISQGEKTSFVLDGVKFNFFIYPHRIIRPFDRRFHPLLLASDEDMVAVKSSIIIRGGKKKDFFDLLSLIKRRNWGLEDVVNLGKEKYENLFVPSTFIKALVYFEEAEKEQCYPEIEKRWKEIKNTMISLVRGFVENHLNSPGILE